MISKDNNQGQEDSQGYDFLLDYHFKIAIRQQNITVMTEEEQCDPLPPVDPVVVVVVDCVVVVGGGVDVVVVVDLHSGRSSCRRIIPVFL